MSFFPCRGKVAEFDLLWKGLAFRDGKTRGVHIFIGLVYIRKSVPLEQLSNVLFPLAGERKSGGRSLGLEVGRRELGDESGVGIRNTGDETGRRELDVGESEVCCQDNICQ